MSRLNATATLKQAWAEFVKHFPPLKMGPGRDGGGAVRHHRRPLPRHLTPGDRGAMPAKGPGKIIAF